MRIVYENRIISGGVSFKSNSDVVSLSMAVKKLDTDEFNLFREYVRRSWERFLITMAEARSQGKVEGSISSTAIHLKRDALVYGKESIISEFGEEAFTGMMSSYDEAVYTYSRELRSDKKLLITELLKNKRFIQAVAEEVMKSEGYASGVEAPVPVDSEVVEDDMYSLL